MLERSLEAVLQGKEAQCRRCRTQKDTLERRVVRAMGLALGELSNARHALEGEAVAPSTVTSCRTPDVPLDFDVDRLLKNLVWEDELGEVHTICKVKGENKETT